MKKKHVAALLLATAVSAAPLGLADAASPPTCKPMRLGGLPDFTGSMNDAGQGGFSVKEVELLIMALKRRCGELALGMITEKSKEPLARLPIESVAGLALNDRAAIAAKNREQEAKFMGDVKARLDRKRNAQTTDVYGALARFNLYFNEPGEPAVDKKLIVFSDGIDSKQKAKQFLPTDVTVYAVGMDKPLAVQWFGKNVVVLESFNAAVKQVSAKN